VGQKSWLTEQQIAEIFQALNYKVIDALHIKREDWRA
jgi:hypothetical protein